MGGVEFRARKTHHMTEVANTKRAEYTPKRFIIPFSVSHLFEVRNAVVPKKNVSHRTAAIDMASLEIGVA